MNGTNITHMHHEDIVNIIKDSALVVTLTVGAPQGELHPFFNHKPLYRSIPVRFVYYMLVQFRF